MTTAVLIVSLLTATPDPGPMTGGSAKAATKDIDEAARAEALAKYNAMRDKAAMTASSQSKLALWCERNGLKAEAYVHLANVVRLDPGREAAWKKLGFKKHGGRWMNDAQIAEEAQQRQGDKLWAQRLRDCHKQIHGGKKQAEARTALGAIDDPAAVPSIYREFGSGGPVDQLIAVGLLGQIDAPVSSKVLAALAVYGKTPEVRRGAVETLRRRPAEDFLGLLVGLMRDLLKYEVKPVYGPGSPGVLFVEGERFNVRRFYAPPTPSLNPRLGDSIGYDANGMPVVSQTFNLGGPSGVPGSKSLVGQRQEVIQYSVPQAMLQVQEASAVAQGELAADVAAVEAINAERARFNEVVMDAARDAIGKSPGRTAKDWRDLLASTVDKYAKRPAREPAKPTMNEMVPIAFNYTYTAQVSFLTKTYVDS